MMICLFSIKYSDTKEEMLRKMKAAIADSNGEFKGNVYAGSFSGKIMFGIFKGRYTIDGVITVIVDEKPFFIGCGMIENKVMGYLKGMEVK